uniref:Uncharacterized protein n=1 Tax=Anguilla anguilla TaxID=7936 RepID=A0A0E9SQT5_ANGAN
MTHCYPRTVTEPRETQRRQRQTLSLTATTRISAQTVGSTPERHIQHTGNELSPLL